MNDRCKRPSRQIPAIAPEAKHPADALVEIKEDGKFYRFVAEVKQLWIVQPPADMLKLSWITKNVVSQITNAQVGLKIRESGKLPCGMPQDMFLLTLRPTIMVWIHFP